MKKHIKTNYRYIITYKKHEKSMKSRSKTNQTNKKYKYICKDILKNIKTNLKHMKNTKTYEIHKNKYIKTNQTHITNIKTYDKQMINIYKQIRITLKTYETSYEQHILTNQKQ